MAITLKNARLAVGTSFSTIYTCPANTTAIIFLCQATNVDGTNAASVDVRWHDNSGATDTHLVKQLTVPADAAVQVIGGSMVLEANDYIEALASTTGDIEITLAIEEQT